MNIQFFGTSAGVATRNRNNSSALILVKNGGLLVDCGEPISASLIRNNIPLDSFSTIILTHLHSDHTGGFTQLIQTMQILRRKAPLTVFMPAEGINVFNQLLNTVYLYRSILPFTLNFEPIRIDRVFNSGSFMLEFFPTEHLVSFRNISCVNAPCESFSVAVSVNNKRIVMSGDYKNISEIIHPLNKKTDLLVSELVHFNPDVFSTIDSNILPEKILFTHYKTTPNDSPVDINHPALTALGKNIIFVNDLHKEEI